MTKAAKDKAAQATATLGAAFAAAENARTHAWRQVEGMCRFGTGSLAGTLAALQACAAAWQQVADEAAAVLPKEPVKVPKEKAKEVRGDDERQT
jgi:hypothetical protein